MAGKEYLLKLRKERIPMRKEIVRLLAENGTLSFQERPDFGRRGKK